MTLIEESQIPAAALPVDRLRAHLRLGSGFAEDSLQDDLLESFLRAAVAAVEARTGKALIARDFAWSLHAWRNPVGEVLPMAPVGAVTELAIADRLGAVSVVDAGLYALEQDTHQPRLVPLTSVLPSVEDGGSVTVRFRAGMADDLGGLPADLAQAVLLLAAHYYEYRDEVALSQGCMPFGVTSLIARYRPLRLGFGA